MLRNFPMHCTVNVQNVHLTDSLKQWYRCIEGSDCFFIILYRHSEAYKKANEGEIDNIKVEHKTFVSNLEIDDRVFATEIQLLDTTGRRSLLELTNVLKRRFSKI